MGSPVRTDTAPILIADDDDAVRASLALLLKQAGHRTHAVGTPDAAIEWLAQHPCALVLQDMNFSRRTSGDEGLELLRRIREAHPLLPVILITAWGSISLAVAGMRLGAADFVTKPWTNPALLQAVQTALRLAGTANGHDVAPITREDLDASYDFDAIVSADARMLKLLQLVGRVAATDASVLITGESGTGKELIADALHRNSHRRKKPFVKVNLGGISASLFESEMFGHVRGAFTDARHDRQGRFDLADGGTIFLDEIGDLDASSQVKLLRVLQDRTYEVLGSSQQRTVDVRVVAATNRSLADMVRRGEFREDLLLPHQPDHRAPAGAARAARRHPAARPPLRAGPRAAPGPRVARDQPGSREVAAGPALARQHPAAETVDRARRARDAGAGARRRRLPRHLRDGRRQPEDRPRPAPAGRQHDDGGDRAGDDPQVAATSWRQRQSCRRFAGLQPRRAVSSTGEVRNLRVTRLRPCGASARQAWRGVPSSSLT